MSCVIEVLNKIIPVLIEYSLASSVLLNRD